MENLEKNGGGLNIGCGFGGEFRGKFFITSFFRLPCLRAT
tara:strand:+ start:1290 stop:1409 length:120 start_codon:yes stop_codon:yes gene_type:complete